MNILSLPYSRIRYGHIDCKGETICSYLIRLYGGNNMFIPNTTVRERQYVHTYYDCKGETIVVLGKNIMSLSYSRIKYEHIVSPLQS
jgi:hypothetical protein